MVRATLDLQFEGKTLDPQHMLGDLLMQMVSRRLRGIRDAPDEHAMLCSREVQYRKRNPAVQARLLFTKKLFDNPPLNSVCMRPA